MKKPTEATPSETKAPRKPRSDKGQRKGSGSDSSASSPNDPPISPSSEPTPAPTGSDTGDTPPNNPPVVNQANTEDQVSEEATPLRTTGWPMRVLHGLAKKIGYRGKPHTSEEELLGAMDRLGSPFPEIATGPLRTPESLWQFSSVEIGAVDGADPEGWWKARVMLDGSFCIHQLVGTNALNRIPGKVHKEDHILEGDNLDELISRLVALRDGVDPILDQHADYSVQQAQIKEAEIKEAPEVPIPVEDAEDKSIRELAIKLGLSNGNTFANVYHCCMGYGIPLREEIKNAAGNDVTVDRDYDAVREELLKKMETGEP